MSIVITSPKTKVIEWSDCIVIVKDGKIESCTEIKLEDGFKEDPSGFVSFVCAIASAIKWSAPAPQRKPRKDKGIRRNSIESNASTNPLISIETPTIVSDPVAKPNRMRKAKKEFIPLPKDIAIIGPVSGIYDVYIKGHFASGKTLLEAATFALEKANLTIADLDKFEQTEEVKKIKEVLTEATSREAS